MTRAIIGPGDDKQPGWGSAARPAGGLPIWQTVTTVYGDLSRVLQAMWMPISCATLVLLAAATLQDMVPWRVSSTPIVGGVFDLVVSAVQNFCLTPVMIAVHRFILLDEVTAGYDIDVRQPGFLRFFGWLMALSIYSNVASSVIGIAIDVGLPIALTISMSIGAVIVGIVISLRMTILFPAIAVETRGARLPNALADTKGHLLSIFMIFLLALLPCGAASVLVTWMLGRGIARAGSPPAIAHLLAGSVIQTIMLILGVAIASRVFQALAFRVSRPG